jgi:C4-dicarboxylate-specific signal transduction histidine kinase
VEFTVRDEGPGFPETRRASPFTPYPSAKAAGSGLGLAISKQLANHLGANLALSESSPGGCLFTLSMKVGNCRGSGQ